MKSFFDHFKSVTPEEYHNYLLERGFITNPIVLTVKEIFNKEPTVVFCGSFGLLLNGFLMRKIHDIDILTLENQYMNGYFLVDDPKKDVRESSDSCKFIVDEMLILSFKLKIHGVVVDVLHNAHKLPVYNQMSFFGTSINVEEPSSAIEFKKKYGAARLLQKHIDDLSFISGEILDMPTTNDDIPW